jgi:hypothetical protein
MGIRDSGHSGLFMETESTGVIDIFDIEVETLLEQASAVSFFSYFHKHHSLMKLGRSN